MNKEVKVGLAIGGVLLSVLIVYVLVVSGEPAPTDQVTLAMPEAGAAEVGGATAPPVDPFAAPSTAAPSPAPEAAPAPAAPEPAAPETAPVPDPVTSQTPSAEPVLAEDKWVALHTGIIEATTTPPVQPQTISENRPAAVVPVGDQQPAAPRNEPAGPVVTAPPASNNQGPAVETDHVIRSGETFSSIAAAAYGSSAYYAHLVRANPSVNPNRLRPGMVIKIPPRTQVVAANTAAETARTLDERSEYRVQGGDSLYKISMKLYGKPDQMDKIYELNKTLIGSDKTKLHVGQVLKLPGQPTARAQ
jgi:nucleoid-associated protein YgaU